MLTYNHTSFGNQWSPLLAMRQNAGIRNFHISLSRPWSSVHILQNQSLLPSVVIEGANKMLNCKVLYNAAIYILISQTSPEIVCVLFQIASGIFFPSTPASSLVFKLTLNAMSAGLPYWENTFIFILMHRCLILFVLLFYTLKYTGVMEVEGSSSLLRAPALL